MNEIGSYDFNAHGKENPYDQYRGDMAFLSSPTRMVLEFNRQHNGLTTEDARIFLKKIHTRLRRYEANGQLENVNLDKDVKKLLQHQPESEKLSEAIELLLKEAEFIE